VLVQFDVARASCACIDGRDARATFSNCTSTQSLGVDCWLDEKNLEGGDVIPDEIIRGIDACQEALVLISPNSVNSQWVSFEIGGVLPQHKRVTPILNNVRPDEMAPMKHIKSIDLNKFEGASVTIGASRCSNSE